MAIVVKHSGNAAPTLVGAYGAGQGKRQAEDAKQMLDIASRAEEAAKQRRFAWQQAEAQRSFQRRESRMARRHDALQREIDRGWRSDEAALADERATERMRLGHEFGVEDMYTQADLREGMAVSDQMRRRDDIEWNYSTKQRQDFQRTFDALAEAQASNDFTDDEMKELRRQAYSKLAGVGPLPSIRERSPYPEGQGIGQTWTSDVGNFLLTRNSKGEISKLGELNTTSAWKIAAEMAKEDVVNKRGVVTGQRINIEKARKFVAEILGQQEDNEAFNQYGVGSVGGDASIDDDDKKTVSGANRWKVRGR